MDKYEAIVMMVNLDGTFVMVVLVVFISLWLTYKKRILLSKEIITAIEKGADIPFPKPKERDYRNLGLIWTFVGLAFTIACWFSTDAIEGAVWGLLPFALGIAFLLIHRKQDKKDKDKNLD